MSAHRTLAALFSAAVATTIALAPVASAAAADGGDTGGASFVVSQSQFDQMFPGHNAFYTYQGLTDALSSYPAFAHTGDQATRRREAAAFLANVSHETAGLKYIVEQNTANYPHYCDTTQSYGCPAGHSAYYGRGPLQLSWNFNYKAAGDALHVDLLDHPSKVEKDATIAWETGLWFWNTESGAGYMTPHDSMVQNKGFGETIRSINGDLECHGKNPDERQDRINLYKQFTGILGVDAGSNLSC